MKVDVKELACEVFSKVTYDEYASSKRPKLKDIQTTVYNLII
jgi:hypothetical protein